MNPDYFPVTSQPVETKATEAYARQHAAAMSLLDRIQGSLENAPAPGGETSIDWGHVGTLSYVNDRLQEIVSFLNSDDFPTS